MKTLVATAGVFWILFFSVAADATELKCGRDYITFQTTGTAKSGPALIITVQKRLVLMVVLSPNGDMAVVIGQDGVPATVTNHITPDAYRHFIRCLD